MSFSKLSQACRPFALAALTGMIAGTVLRVSPCSAQEASANTAPRLADERQKASYAFGMNLGLGWKRSGMEMDAEAMAQGMKDVQAGKAPLLTEKEMNDTLAKFTRDMRLLERQRRDQTAQTNRDKGASFLEHNKTQAGVVTLPSGLQYKIIAEGAGAGPAPTNWVSLKFRATRLDGTEFETSHGYPQADCFKLSSVIPAWAEALPRMKPGAEWQLFVPPALAYGQNGSHVVGPNETIIYDLTLVAVLDSTRDTIRSVPVPDND